MRMHVKSTICGAFASRRQRSATAGLLLALLLAAPALAQTAVSPADRAEATLKQGDLEGALQLFKQAVRESPDNPALRQRAILVQRIVTIRSALDGAADPEDWMMLAEALHSFYHENGILSEALVVDQKIHDKLRTPASAMLLARTLLALEKNKQTIELLESQSVQEAPANLHTLLALALARESRAADAQKVLLRVKLDEMKDQQVLLDAACVQARLNEPGHARALLVRSLQNTPPSRLEVARAQIKACPDLAGLRSSADFATVLATESQVTESQCSGGTSCGSCPSKTSCSSGESKESCTSSGEHQGEPKPAEPKK